MPESKRPSLAPNAKRVSAKPAAPRKPTAQAEIEARLEKCESQLASARHEIGTLRAEFNMVSARLESLNVEMALAAARVRKLPPPLPAENWDDVISVDEKEVILESIRPPAAMAHSKEKGKSIKPRA